MSRRAAQPERLTWEPTRLYWALVHAPGWRRTGEVPPGLRPELEDEVPLPPDELHAVCVPVGDGRVVVCAAARSALENLPATAVSLTPATVPECLGAEVPPASLNLLVGEFAPVAMRRARRRAHLVAVAGVLLCAALAAFGLQRRAAHWQHVAEQAAAARVALIADAGLADRGEHALLLEVARLRRRVQAAAAVRPPADASLALVNVLKAWPADVPSRPERLSVSPGGATISVALDGDAAPFLGALRPPQGWRAGEPRLNASGGVTRLTLQLGPESPQQEGTR